ncbi:MAG: RDD family protein [Candidatus Omnitrophota bacterium]
MTEPSKKLDIDLEFLDKKEQVRVAPKSEAKEVQTEKKPEASVKATVHPWMRYWARYIDIVAFSLVFGIFLAIFMPSILESSNIFLTILILFVWIFAESSLLSSWGTTPGKWLLKIKLTGPGGKPEFSAALNRSFSVWLKGLGLGIPIISLFTLISSYNHLTKEGITSWDKDGHFTVTHGKIGIIRIIAAIIVSVIFLFLIFGE